MSAAQQCAYCFRWSNAGGEILHADDCIPGQEEKARAGVRPAPFGCVRCPSLEGVARDLFVGLFNCGWETREDVKESLQAKLGRQLPAEAAMMPVWHWTAELVLTLLASAGADRLPTREALVAWYRGVALGPGPEPGKEGTS